MTAKIKKSIEFYKFVLDYKVMIWKAILGGFIKAIIKHKFSELLDHTQESVNDSLCLFIWQNSILRNHQ